MSDRFILGGKDLNNHQNFQHFIGDHVCMLGTYLLNNMNTKIIIPNRISSEKKIPFYNSCLKEVLKVLKLEDRVVLTDDVSLYNTQVIESAWIWSKGKECFFNTLRLNLPTFKEGPKKVYIRRTWGYQPNEIGGHTQMRRGILNDEELCKFLIEKEYEVVDFNGKSFEYKKSILQHAENVIVQTSAACVNLFLCENVKRIIFITNDVFIMARCFEPYIPRPCVMIEIPFQSVEREKYTDTRGKEYGIDNCNFFVNLQQLNNYVY